MRRVNSRRIMHTFGDISDGLKGGGSEKSSGVARESSHWSNTSGRRLTCRKRNLPVVIKNNQNLSINF